jgi:RanBP1 domain/Zn-finger in Ran binding protein and others
MKMTWNPDSCKVRLIMRREQVLKVCCNHFLAKDMKLLPISSSDRSWSWVAQDYSDGTLETETFALKFKLPEEAALFHDKWLELQEAMDDSNHYLKHGKKPVAKVQATTEQSLSDMFKPAKGYWECQMCYVSNRAEATTCAACSTLKPGAAAAASAPKAAAPALTADKDLMKQFKKPEGSWSCDLCYVQNKPDDAKCAACETPRPGASPEKAAAPPTKNIAPGLTFDFKTPSKGASQFSFGFNPAVTSAAPATTAAPTWATSAPAFSFGTPSTPAATSSTSFAFGTAQPSFSFGLSGSKEATTTTTPSFGFSMPAVISASSIASTAFSTPQVENEESDDEVENDEGEHIHFTVSTL